MVEEEVKKAESFPADLGGLLPPHLRHHARGPEGAAGSAPKDLPTREGVNMVMMNMVQSINLALREEMERDPSVVLLGEDVGVDGGVFRVTEGLLDRFGKERVIDTPLAEAGIVGDGHRHGHERPAPGGRDPVHGVQLS